MPIALRVPVKDPGMPPSDQRLSGVYAMAGDVGNGAAIAIYCLRLDHCLLPEAQRSKGLPGQPAVRLIHLRGVYGTETNLEKFKTTGLTAARSQGVPVADHDYEAHQCDSEAHRGQIMQHEDGQKPALSGRRTTERMLCSGCGLSRPTVVLTESVFKPTFGLTADAGLSDRLAR